MRYHRAGASGTSGDKSSAVNVTEQQQQQRGNLSAGQSTRHARSFGRPSRKNVFQGELRARPSGAPLVTARGCWCTCYTYGEQLHFNGLLGSSDCAEVWFFLVLIGMERVFDWVIWRAGNEEDPVFRVSSLDSCEDTMAADSCIVILAGEWSVDGKN